jgi:hypothetical protein
MTIFGGEETTWGTRKNGFYMVCCNCGWESEVSMNIEGEYYDVAYIRVLCGKCGNVARVDEQ